MARKPNLLFLFTDEQRFDTLGAYGNRLIETPFLNRLAETSTVFEKAYVTQPVCTPSRSSILTGQTPHECGCTENNIALRQDTLCLPEMVSPDTYATAYHGKWHLGDEIFAQHGFQEWRSIEDGYWKHYSAGRSTEERSTYHHWLLKKGCSPQDGQRFGRGEVARYPEALSKPAYLGEEASRFIRENQDRPFILYVNFLEPHMPFYGPRDDQYEPRNIPLPGNFDHDLNEDTPLKARLFREHYYHKGHSGLALKTREDWQRMIANYWGLCSQVDTHAGRILKTLEDCGLMGETIIVYTSDHGDMMGSHRLLAKCLQFEEAVRVPLMIRCPQGAMRKRVEAPVSQIDLVPTLLDMMGEKMPSSLHGKSLRPLMEVRGKSQADPVFIEWNGPNSGIASDVVGSAQLDELPEYLRAFGDPASLEATLRDPVRTIVTQDGWKLNWSFLGNHELYDLKADPLETRNVANDPNQAGRIDEMRDRIRNWQERTSDIAPTVS